MDQIGLASLISPCTVNDFILSSWPEEPFVVHGLGKTIEPLKNLSFLQSVDSMLGVWPHLVQAHLPLVADESSAIDVLPGEAKRLFDDKMGLLFNNVQTVHPLLNPWLENIKKELGLPASTFARCIVYATPDGKGTAAHFDQNINFVLQMQGIKKWKLSPNLHAENPTQRFTIGQPIDSELATYAHASMPISMPLEDQREIILKPGSMLFVPRGYWHSTEADGEALALNFTFSQPTYADLFLAALRSRLLLSSEWRELADGVSSVQPERQEMAQQKLEFLLQELTLDLPHWQAADILASTEESRSPEI